MTSIVLLAYSNVDLYVQLGITVGNLSKFFAISVTHARQTTVVRQSLRCLVFVK